MVNIKGDKWYWHHNISECYYHIQLTVKYRKSLLEGRVKEEILGILRGLKERYDIEVTTVGFDKDHMHMIIRFLPKYSGGEVIKLVKSLTAKQVFKKEKWIKQELWGGEFWTDGYYIATVSGRGSKNIIEEYVRKQGGGEGLSQLELFTF
ncbi:MAG: IS200/IS605 family transposase [Herbaspirillum sp.]|nr:IS200/IS605 family transposase [Herbaspirillum sp.]